MANNILEIYNKYYQDNEALLAIILKHSEFVARKALLCAENKKLDIDKTLLYEAAMFHDIGVVKCNAPSIYAFGDLNYICHGVEGRKIMEGEGRNDIALVCERHTGSGLSIADIINQNLPLPRRDMLPETLIEKLVCYADKFFSKSKNIEKEKSLGKVLFQMRAHGEESLQRFLKLHEMFS